MLLNYIRRYRMEIDLTATRLPDPVLAEEYNWVGWNAGLVDRHAAVKFASFRTEIDSHVFPALGEPMGCRRLMTEISGHHSFLPEATWLICFRGDSEFHLEPADCATIQGVVKSKQTGSIQNVGVVPEHRGQGLGRALVIQSLYGFRRANLRRVYLEVTAENERAVALYKSIGFRVARTMYQAVDLEPEIDFGQFLAPVRSRRAFAGAY